MRLANSFRAAHHREAGRQQRLDPSGLTGDFCTSREERLVQNIGQANERNSATSPAWSLLINVQFALEAAGGKVLSYAYPAERQAD